MSDLPMLFRKLDALVYALAAVATTATTTEFPGPVREHIDVLSEEIETLMAEIRTRLNMGGEDEQ